MPVSAGAISQVAPFAQSSLFLDLLSFFPLRTRSPSSSSSSCLLNSRWINSCKHRRCRDWEAERIMTQINNVSQANVHLTGFFFFCFRLFFLSLFRHSEPKAPKHYYLWNWKSCAEATKAAPAVCREKLALSSSAEVDSLGSLQLHILLRQHGSRVYAASFIC